MADFAIETQGLSKRFRSQLAVDGIDLAVPSGAVFGFLGPNGSGKTTTIRMLLGLVAASSGSARVLGTEMPGGVGRVLPRVGALVEGPAFSPYLSGEANLRRFDAADRGAPGRSRSARVAAALDRVGLSHAAGKKVHAYSLGMKQRLGLANALLMPRELLVLDEPTNGLDPQGTREVRGLIRSLADDGTTVFVSSHLLAEVEQICSHLAVMRAGRLVAQGTLDDFRSAGEATVRVQTPDPAAARAVLAGLGLELEQAVGPDAAAPAPGGAAGAVDGNALVIARLDGRPPETVVAALVAAGVRVRGFEAAHASLEQRFVDLTGEGFDVVQ
ncbi:multidrug ABC transporter ATP-binding protein [Leifsonia sp. Root4]|uniref:ABC transporter ATP-binding protein n=1 Tax=Leifsonia sp. Root4 TaxID=1736525 RepID=UPI000700C2D3|nr:ATP-binding cassette domain-containing protein [Leifsonia sp. Root4]KQW08416.1 multidrug ABC transporter ATP-binding protein [Leifsonia sp. Root4]